MTATLAALETRSSFASASPSQRSVLFLLGGLRIGGAERQAVAIAAELQRLGVRVSIVSLADGPLRAAVEREQIDVSILGRPFGIAPACIPHLRRTIHSLNPDVVYAFLEVQWLLAAGAVAGPRHSDTGPMLVYGLRTGSYPRPSNGLRPKIVHALACRAASRADLLIANSESGLSDYMSQCAGEPPGVVIHNGIDMTRFVPSPAAGAALRRELCLAPDAFVVGHVGRLDRVKNHELLIESFAAFSARRSAELVCVGDGSSERRTVLERHAAKYGVADRVHFVGPRTDLAAVYSAFDMLGLSSDREGFANVIAEAMACGTPAVVTDVGASREIVANLGEVAPPHDANAFAAALDRMVARLSPDLSVACRDRIAESYTLRVCAIRTLEAFDSLLPARTN